MQYGLNLPNAGTWGNPQVSAGLAQLAEDSGWDGVFLEDYIVWQSRQDVPTYDPWITLAAMALQTKHIRLGTMVTPLARRRPWKLAHETVSLDYLSGGAPHSWHWFRRYRRVGGGGCKLHPFW